MSAVELFESTDWSMLSVRNLRDLLSSKMLGEPLVEGLESHLYVVEIAASKVDAQTAKEWAAAKDGRALRGPDGRWLKADA